MMSFVLALLSFLTTLPAHFAGGTSLSRPFWVLSFLDLSKVAEVQVTVSESENPPRLLAPASSWRQVWCMVGTRPV